MKKLFFSVFFLSFMCFNLGVVEASDLDWKQFRYNSENNPVIENKKISVFVDKIKTNNEIRSTPVVVEDKVFIGNHESGEIYAYNIETGELIWKNQAENWIHSEIIYVNNQLFVGYGNRFIQENGNPWNW